MTRSYKADEIGDKPKCIIEDFIKEILLTRNTSVKNAPRYWFSEVKFDTTVDIESNGELATLLMYFDDIGMCMRHVYNNATLSMSLMSDEDMKFASLIENGHMTTFEDFITHD